MPLLELFFESVGQDPVFRHSCLVSEDEPERVIGRDGACDVCLPDPDKTISRRHLAVWNESGSLWFRVLSSVNGVDLPGGEVPPGARALLPLDQTLTLGGYQLYVTVAPAATLADDDTVVEPMDFQHSVSPTIPLMSRTQAIQTQAPEYDPFADWAFQTDTMGKALGLDNLSAQPSQEMVVFFKAVGLDPFRIGSLSTEEIDTLGRVVRLGLEGLLGLEFRRKSDRHEPQEPGLLTNRSENPLHHDWTLENKLRYLLGGRAASIGFVKPELALKQLIADIQIHQQASLVAVRTAPSHEVNASDAYTQEVQRLSDGRNRLSDE